MLFISMSAIKNIIITCIDFVRRPESDIQHILFKHIFNMDFKKIFFFF